jgi:cytochrome b involved in lipid metabolism
MIPLAMTVSTMADVSGAQKSPAVALPEYTLKEVALHNRKDDNWIVIHGHGKSHAPLRRVQALKSSVA